MTTPRINRDHKARDYTDRDGAQVLLGVIHATAGENSLGWLKGNPRQTSIHVLNPKDGPSYEMLDDKFGANHVGYSEATIQGVRYARKGTRYNCNQISVGIEIENLNNGRDPYPKDQLITTAWWMNHWNVKFGLNRANWVMHRDIDTQGKSDAAGLTIDHLFSLINDAMTVPLPGLTPGLAGESTILASPRTGQAQALAYLLRMTQGGYTPGDKKLIVDLYWKYGEACGIDPLMAIAQMVHETGTLTSWWSQRERRNPAGIGVTGATRKTTKSPGVGWTRDGAYYKQGYSFASWDLAIRAHYGHLLVYAVPESLMTKTQREFVALDPRAPAVPKVNRGVCGRWLDLNGRWAVPGTIYGQMVASVANKILR